MKTITDIFDIVLLLVILGIMLPFLFTSANKLTNTKSYGIEATEDKTMRLVEGDYSVWSDDSGSKSEDLLQTAADIILMIKTANTEKLNCRLPNGTVITVDENYSEKVESYVATARSCLDGAKKYSVKYDYATGIWQIN